MTSERTLNRLARIFALIAWSASHPYPSAEDVIERFGYSDHQELVKDLNLLFCCGLPGYGPEDLMVAFMEGGVVILDEADYLSRPLRLAPNEVLGLLIAGRAVAGTSYGSEALDRALGKLIAASFPQGSTPDGLVPMLAAELPPEPKHFGVLQEAARTGTVVSLTYVALSSNETTIRDVEPHLVSASMGQWYLQAHCRLVGSPRTFRLDRIQFCQPTAERFTVPERPPDPAGVGYTPSADATYMTIALSRQARWLADYYPLEVISDDGEELVVRMAVSDSRWGARLLLRLGSGARLVEGDQVREERRRLATDILARYR